MKRDARHVQRMCDFASLLALFESDARVMSRDRLLIRVQTATTSYNRDTLSDGFALTFSVSEIIHHLWSGVHGVSMPATKFK